MNKEKLIEDMINNLVKLLSAVLDANNGQIEVDEEIFNNANMMYSIVADKKDGKVIFTKNDAIDIFQEENDIVN